MVRERFDAIVKEIGTTLEGVDAGKMEQMASSIAKAPRIFLGGVGRSGYMMRAFTMRLMHCGLDAHFIGDSSTPGAKAGDVLILGSGSGETESLKAYALKAKKIGLTLLLITTVPDSTIGSLSDICLPLRAPTPKALKDGGFSSVQPMGSLFEQCLLLCMDELVIEVMDKLGLRAEAMFSRHANLE